VKFLTDSLNGHQPRNAPSVQLPAMLTLSEEVMADLRYGR
jgi:hypothetical protein